MLHNLAISSAQTLDSMLFLFLLFLPLPASLVPLTHHLHLDGPPKQVFYSSTLSISRVSQDINQLDSAVSYVSIPLVSSTQGLSSTKTTLQYLPSTKHAMCPYSHSWSSLQATSSTWSFSWYPMILWMHFVSKDTDLPLKVTNYSMSMFHSCTVSDKHTNLFLPT